MKKWIASRLVVLIVVLALLMVAIPIMINLTTESPPQLVKEYPWLPSIILALLTIVYVVFSILQVREPNLSHESDEPQTFPKWASRWQKRAFPAVLDASSDFWTLFCSFFGNISQKYAKIKLPFRQPLEISKLMTDQRASSPYIVGPPIKDPAHFFGRKAEVKRFFDNLNSPQIDSLQVLGIRRAGKTSFLRYVSHPEVVGEKVRDADNTLVIYIDLQADVKTVANFYMALAEGTNRCLPKGKRLGLPSMGFLNRRAFVRWLDSPQLANYRLIFLLDEFERLWEDARPEEAPFNANFFAGLRALVNLDSVRLAWVTSSYIDLYSLSRDLGKDEKTSPFFNIFDPDPLVLGGLTSEEADDLIRKPAEKYGIKFDSNELSSIKQLAGQLPFLLQTGGKAWFEAKQEGQQDFHQIKDKVKQKLAAAMRNHFDWYWRHFDDDERELLSIIASNNLIELRTYLHKHGGAVLNDLIRYGLVTQEKRKHRIAGQVFADWIGRNHERVTGPDSDQATNRLARR